MLRKLTKGFIHTPLKCGRDIPKTKRHSLELIFPHREQNIVLFSLSLSKDTW